MLYSSPERTLYLDELLSDVPEISMIWRDCEHYLESIDSRFGPEPEPVNIDAIAEPISLPPTRRAEDPPEIQAKLREIRPSSSKITPIIRRRCLRQVFA